MFRGVSNRRPSLRGSYAVGEEQVEGVSEWSEGRRLETLQNGNSSRILLIGTNVSRVKTVRASE